MDLESSPRRVEELLVYAYTLAHKSPDPSTQNSAFLIEPSGMIHLETEAVNEFPPGVKNLKERWKRPEKYNFVSHAETGAILLAAKHGLPTKGLVLVSPWAACAVCAQNIIRCGISALITHQPWGREDHADWGPSIDKAMTMFKEAKVQVIIHKGRLGGDPILRDGKPWSP